MTMRTNLRSSKQITLIPIIINLKKTDFGFKVYETEATVISNQLNTQTLAKSTTVSIFPLFSLYLS